MASNTEGDDDRAQRPLGLSWQAIYGLVLAALAVQIVLYAALTAIYQ